MTNNDETNETEDANSDNNYSAIGWFFMVALAMVSVGIGYLCGTGWGWITGSISSVIIIVLLLIGKD